MKRDAKCEACNGSGRDEKIVAKSDAWIDPHSGLEHPAYEGPAQCNLCAGTGQVSTAPAPVAHLKVPVDHPRAKEIQALLDLKEPA